MRFCQNSIILFLNFVFFAYKQLAGENLTGFFLFFFYILSKGFLFYLYLKQGINNKKGDLNGERKKTS